jgi:RNA polymerase sigma-70 factor (ECF subfamily)
MTIRPKQSLLTLLTENYGELVKRLSLRVGGTVDANDIVQDAFLRLQRVSAEQIIENPRSYLFRIADNLAIDHIRSRTSQARRLEQVGDIHLIASGDPSPERIIDYRQRLARLEGVISELPDRQRKAFLMHKLDGLSHSEVAQVMGISKSGVEKLITKALARCRDGLDDLID